MTLQPLPSIYSIESLEKWLRKFAPGNEVGVNRKCEDCPAARWFRSEVGGYVNVGQAGVIIDSRIYHCPKWLASFIAGIDAMGGKITAAKALKVLESVKKGMKDE